MIFQLVDKDNNEVATKTFTTSFDGELVSSDFQVIIDRNSNEILALPPSLSNVVQAIKLDK